ncbi:hypothetical protein BX600DRAFT_472165 [Xylariales sp. PMI_506]|nr:hypothetical protein BX600DRAFT_472165 [Xylariales sp. PMI_506]
MSAPPYLIFGLSKPTTISENLWIDWYTRERLPQLISSKVALRATLYREIPFPGFPVPANRHDFLVLVQTDSVDGHDDSRISNLPNTSDLFLSQSQSAVLMENHHSEVRDYKLIQDFYPEPCDRDPPSQLMSIEMEPQDELDFDRWYREEHIPLLKLAPGYCRSTRYRWLAKETFTGDGNPPLYLALHEVDDVEIFMQSHEAKEANSTVWTQRHVTKSKTVAARAWKRLATLSG